ASINAPEIGFAGGGTAEDEFAELLTFENVSAVGFLGALETVTTYLDQMKESPIFSAEIPFTGGETIGDLVDFSSAFSDALLANARRSDALDVNVFTDLSESLGIATLAVKVDGESVSVSVDLAGNDYASHASALEAAIDTELGEDRIEVTFFESEVVDAANGPEATRLIRKFRFQSNTHGEAGSVQVSATNDVAAQYFNLEAIEEVPGQPRFNTIQGFQQLFAETAVDTIDFIRVIPGQEGNPPELILDLDLDQTFTFDDEEDPRTLSIDFGIGDLVGFDASTDIELTAHLGAQLSLGIQLATPGAGFQLTHDMSLSELNGDDAFVLNSDENPEDETGDGLEDIEVQLRDGSTFTVNFDGSTTVGDILERFNLADGVASGDGNSFTVAVDASEQAFELTDHTVASLGDATALSVTAINGSLTGFSVGLLGTADPEFPGVLTGVPLHGQSVADQVFLRDFFFQPSITLSANEVEANANLGFVEITIEGSEDQTDRDLAGTIGAVLSLGDDERGVAGGTLTVADMLDLLPKLSTRLKADGSVPENGRLSANQRFEVQVGDTAPFELFIPKALTSENKTASDLADDVNLVLTVKSLLADFVTELTDTDSFRDQTKESVKRTLVGDDNDSEDNGLVGGLVTGLLNRLIESKIEGGIEEFLFEQATELATGESPEELTTRAGEEASRVAADLTDQLIDDLVDDLIDGLQFLGKIQVYEQSPKEFVDFSLTNPASVAPRIGDEVRLGERLSSRVALWESEADQATLTLHDYALDIGESDLYVVERIGGLEAVSGLFVEIVYNEDQTISIGDPITLGQGGKTIVVTATRWEPTKRRLTANFSNEDLAPQQVNVQDGEEMLVALGDIVADGVAGRREVTPRYVRAHDLLKFGTAGDRLTVFLKDGVARPVHVSTNAPGIDPENPTVIPTTELGWSRA
ncbi:MAG: hypothetical protein AAFU85_31860, partial [Planctomycetota bacterium]